MKQIGVAVLLIVVLVALVVVSVQWQLEVKKSRVQQADGQKTLTKVNDEIARLKSEDQRVRNDTLEKQITDIEKTYKDAVGVYEELVKLKESKGDTKKLDEDFADALSLLSKRNYASASGELTQLRGDIKKEQDKRASEFTIPQNVATNNAPPGSGFSRQKAEAEGTSYLVDIIAADLGSTKVIVDTASEKNCKQDCPVMSLGAYAARSGAFAGINGSYFCPSTYPACADKKNSFDTLLMNKNKVYFNSDNNKYSTVPAVIFGSGWIRFVSRTLDWGRDTSIDGMIANQPLLLMGGNVAFGGDEDPKKESKGSRSFVARKDNTIYIGVVYNATVAEAARVLKAMGMGDALNMDSGGSTALWFGGYKVGPGRDIPNAILFVRR